MIMNVEAMARWCSSMVILVLIGCDPGAEQFDGESLEFSEDSPVVGELEIDANDLPTAGCAGGPAPRNASEVKFCNEEDEPVIANVGLPAGTPPPGGWPTVVVLHGSGGLYKQLAVSDPSLGTCSDQLENQFAYWKQLLTSKGYAVVMPASFYSRGFCDWDKDSANIPEGAGKDERLLWRLLDTRAAAKWACDNPAIDCDRMAVMGFSNGGSGVLISMHDDLSDAKDLRFAEHGTQEWFVGGIAFYPGCGLEGVLTYSLDPKNIAKFFSPQAPVIVHHAEDDSLLDTCQDVRDPQVALVAKAENRAADWFDLRVYAGADHGFDNAKKGDPAADLAARDAARAATLDQLAKWLQPQL